MRILLLGASGQVGTELRRALQSIPNSQVVAATTSGSLDEAVCETADFRDPAAVASLVRTLRPDVVVNAAAHTAVDRAEQEVELSQLINAATPTAVAATCAEVDIPLVHYSTDYVFDGNGTSPYQVRHPTAPLGVYGASKLAGEEGIRSSGAKHVILRTAWVYGNHGHNFMRTMLRLADKEQLNVVNDQIGGPTPAWLIADVTAEILRKGIGAGGTHHVVTSGDTSWAGFADAIFDEAMSLRLIGSRPAVNGIPSIEYPTPAKRPAYSVLDTTSLRETYAVTLPTWRDALRKTLETA